MRTSNIERPTSNFEVKKAEAVANWGKDGTGCASDAGAPMATIIYDGGNPPPTDIGQRVVEFFKTVSPGM